MKNPVDRQLVVLYSWLQAKHKHLMKYVELYIEKGYDVLAADVAPWQLLWPVNGSQLVAQDIVNFLYHNTHYYSLLIHGFSVGGYLYGECLVIMSRDLDKYQPLINRFVGQIWDSVADFTEIPVGVPKALFPRNHKLQSALEWYMNYHMKTFHETATQHYLLASDLFYSALVACPALYFSSKCDPVGSVVAHMRVCDLWEAKGIRVSFHIYCIPVIKYV